MGKSPGTNTRWRRRLTVCDLDLCDNRWLGWKRECAGCARSQFGAMPSPIQVSEDLSLRMSACRYPYLVLLQAVCVLICLFNSSTAYAGSSALWYSRLNNVMMLLYSEQLRLEARTLGDKVPTEYCYRYHAYLALRQRPFLFLPRLASTADSAHSQTWRISLHLGLH